MILCLLIICLCFTNVVGPQPREDGLGHKLPDESFTIGPSAKDNKADSKKEGEIKTKEENGRRNKENKMEKENLNTDLLPVGSTTSKHSKIFDIIGLVDGELDKGTQINDNSPIDSTSKEPFVEDKKVNHPKEDERKLKVEKEPEMTQDQLKDIADQFKWLQELVDKTRVAKPEDPSDVAKSETAFSPPQHTTITHSEKPQISSVRPKSDSESETKLVLSVEGKEPVKSCQVNPYGNVCTYVLLLSSGFYYHHIVQRF